MSHPDGGLLKEKDILKIRADIARLRKEKNIVNRDIKDDVFTILENECRVIYYPISDTKLWAFYHKDKYEDGRLRKFVFINTSLPYERQIFAAAHELAHIWGVSADESETLVTSTDEDSPIRMDEAGSERPSKEELIANRFAAEFLMDGETVRILYERCVKEKNNYPEEVKQITLVLCLMDYYLVPFKMTVLRLLELGLISPREEEALLAVPEEGGNSIRQLQKRLGLCERNNEITGIKKFADFVDLVLKDYKKELITFSKAKQLLSIFDLTPESMGISEEKDPEFFTSEELDAILEDE